MEIGNKLLKLQYELLKVISAQEGKLEQRDESLDWERVHMASCGRLAWEMALERGINPELAACAASVHDFGRILTGKQPGHAEAGYEPVQVFLQETGLFDKDEIQIISLAVKNHSSKTIEGTPIEEIVKDADVVDCYQYGYPLDRPEKTVRYNKWLESRK